MKNEETSVNNYGAERLTWNPVSCRYDSDCSVAWNGVEFVPREKLAPVK